MEAIRFLTIFLLVTGTASASFTGVVKGVWNGGKAVVGGIGKVYDYIAGHKESAAAVVKAEKAYDAAKDLTDFALKNAEMDMEKAGKLFSYLEDNVSLEKMRVCADVEKTRLFTSQATSIAASEAQSRASMIRSVSNAAGFIAFVGGAYKVYEAKCTWDLERERIKADLDRQKMETDRAIADSEARVAEAQAKAKHESRLENEAKMKEREERNREEVEAQRARYEAEAARQSNASREKQRTIDEKDVRIADLEEQLKRQQDQHAQEGRDAEAYLDRVLKDAAAAHQNPRNSGPVKAALAG